MRCDQVIIRALVAREYALPMQWYTLTTKASTTVSEVRGARLVELTLLGQRDLAGVSDPKLPTALGQQPRSFLS